MTTKVAVPIEINDLTLASSGIPEPDPSVGEVEWEDLRKLDLFGSYTGDYRTATLANNGNIYCVGSSGTVLKIDPSAKSTSTFGGYAGSYRAAALGDDGNIYCVGSSGTVLKIDVSSETISLFGTFAGYYYTACKARGGDIYCTGNNGGVLKINTTSKTTSMIAGNLSISYLTSTLANNGNIYCAGSSPKILKINVENDTLEEFGDVSSKYSSSCVGVDGNVYCVGSGGNVLKIDVTTNSIEIFGSYAGILYTCELMGDGDIYCIGGSWSASQVGTEAVIISTNSKTISTFGWMPSTLQYYTSTMGSDGNMYSVGTATNQSRQVIKISKSHRAGDRVIKSSTHRVYQCLATTRQDPEEGATGDAAAEWIDIGSTNKWKMFDESVSYSSLISINTSVAITPLSEYNAVGCVGISGIDSVTIEILDQSDSTLYTETKSTENPDPEFSEFKLSEILFTDIPPFINTKVKVTFNVDSGGGGKVGDLIVGKSYNLGSAVLGTQSDTKDYSAQEYDTFGNFSYIERPIVPYVTYQIDVKKENAIAVQRFVNSLRGKSNLWYADIGEAEFLTVYGRCETIPMTYENHSIVSYKAKVRGTI